MNAEQSVKRDERTVAVQNASYKWAYHFLLYGLLLDCLYRHKVRNEDVGDLLALGCVSVAVITVYLIRHKAAVPLWPRRWGRTVTVRAGCIVVAVLVLFLTILWLYLVLSVW